MHLINIKMTDSVLYVMHGLLECKIDCRIFRTLKVEVKTRPKETKWYRWSFVVYLTSIWGSYLKGSWNSCILEEENTLVFLCVVSVVLDFEVSLSQSPVSDNQWIWWFGWNLVWIAMFLLLTILQHALHISHASWLVSSHS